MKAKYEQMKSQFDEEWLSVMLIVKQITVCLDSLVPTLDQAWNDLEEDHSAIVVQESNQKQKEPNYQQSLSNLQPIVNSQSSNQQEESNDDEWVSVKSAEEESMGDPFELEDIIKAAGLGSSQYEITIELSSCLSQVKSAQNEELFQIVQTSLNELVHVHEPLIAQWIQVLTEYTGVATATAQEHHHPLNPSLMKRCIELNHHIATCKNKCKDLNVQPSSSTLPQHTNHIHHSQTLIHEITTSLVKKRRRATKQEKKQKKLSS